MAKRDFYEVLEVTRTATIDEIKKSYRKKALEFHPDRNPGNPEAEEKFKEATDAYSILSDTNGRQKYDQFGMAAFEQQGANGFQGFGDFSGFEDAFGDLFSAFFGGSQGGGRARGRQGRDLKYDLQVNFDEAVFGTDKTINISRRVACDTCEGTGAKKGTKPERCAQCAGSGQMRVQQGFFTIQRPCNVCSGTGVRIKDPCSVCLGQGLKSAQSQIKVKVPAGIDQGQRLKLRGEGEAGGAGGSAGDLYVEIAIKPHKFFEREETELVCAMPIAFSELALGTKLKIPTLDGEESVDIPAGTQPEKVFRVKGKGVPALGEKRRGDLHVRLQVDVPKKISAKRREALEKLREIEIEESKNDKSFFDKMKDIFAN